MKQCTKTNAFNLICYGIIGAFFVTIAICCPPGIYGDSGQYIDMHMHREPVYPLFLCLFRTIFGTTCYLSVVVWIQNIINAVVTICFLSFFSRRFLFIKFQMVVGTIVLLLPHIMTPLFSKTRLVLTSAILGEAISLPLFYLYLLFLIAYVIDGKKKDMIWSIAFALIISLTRGAMMICMIAWALAVIVRLVFEKKKWYLWFAPVLCLLLLMKLRSGIYLGYNYVVNGVNEANMCGNMNLVTNILYASDREAGECIEDDEVRQIFYEIYDKAEADGLTYKFGGEDAYSRINHLENTHDNLKFNYILQTEQDYFEANYGTDYIERNKFQEETCRVIAFSIWSSCFGRWVFQYLGLAVNGLVRSIAIVTPITVIPVMLLGIASFVLCIYSFIKKRHVKETLTLFVVLIMLAANAFGTATVIMCLSRYMIYSFAPFYLALCEMIVIYFKDWRKEKKNEL